MKLGISKMTALCIGLSALGANSAFAYSCQKQFSLVMKALESSPNRPVVETFAGTDVKTGEPWSVTNYIVDGIRYSMYTSQIGGRATCMATPPISVHGEVFTMPGVNFNEEKIKKLTKEEAIKMLGVEIKSGGLVPADAAQVPIVSGAKLNLIKALK